MGISSTFFGRMPDGQEVKRFTLENPQGFRAEVITYGARITNIWTPDRNGTAADVIWGYDTLEEYRTPRDSQGAIIGRYAGLIRDAHITIDGQFYSLVQNAGRHQLHGGTGTGACFSEKVWTVESVEDGDAPQLTLSLDSLDGEGGYPGNLHVQVSYTVTTDSMLRIRYRAVCDKDTAINLTSHCFFNLNGCDGASIHHQKLWVRACGYTVTDGESIPTGEILPVTDTPFDFQESKTLGRDISGLAKGYNHNLVLSSSEIDCPLVASLYDPDSGRKMDVYTDQPGLQIYTAGGIPPGKRGKHGMLMRPQGAICLETQHFPDSVHQPHFPSTILRAGEIFGSTTVYGFGIQ